MKTFRRTAQFKQDVKQMQRRGKDLEKLKDVLEGLANNENLSQKYRDRVLVWQYKGTRECHIEPDWLLLRLCSALFRIFHPTTLSAPL